MIAIAPMLYVVVRYAGRHFVPLGDAALIEMRVRRVWSTDTPLLGMYSRYGWYHPGPAMFWALSPFSLLAGGAAWGTLVGCAVVQAAAIGWSARLAWQRAGLLLVLTVLTVQLLAYVGLETFEPMLRPWNPFLAFPFLPVFVLLVWSVGLGDARPIPWALAVASVLVQVHLGYGMVVAAGLAWLLVLGWRRWRAGALQGPLRRIGWTSAAVLGVLWALPVVEVVREGSHSNVAQLLRYWRYGRLSGEFRLTNVGNEPAGLWSGARVFAAEFDWVPSWLGGTSAHDPFHPLLAVPVPGRYLAVPALLVVIGTVAAVRARNVEAIHAVGLVTLLSGAGIVSIALVRGELTDFAFYWRISLAVLLVAATLGALVTSLPWWDRVAVRAAVATVLAGALVAASVTVTRGVADGDREWEPGGETVIDLVDQMERRGFTRPVPMRATTDLTGFLAAVVGELERRGATVPLSVAFARRYTGSLSATPAREVGRRLYLVQGAEIGRFLDLPGAEEVAAVSPLRPAAERRARAIQRLLVPLLPSDPPEQRAQLMRDLDSPGVATLLADVEGVDPRLTAELADLNGRLGTAKRLAVVALPDATIPPGALVW